MRNIVLGLALYIGFSGYAAGQEGAPQSSSDGSSLKELQAQIQELRRESIELRRELDALRQQLDLIRNAPSPDVDISKSQDSEEPPRVDAVSTLAEEQQLLNAKVQDQYQTKVESGSRYRVRLSGIALMNAFSTRGSVDSLDLPRFALSPVPGDSRGSVGASARQSQIHFEVAGPEWRGAKTTGDMSLDFWGGFPSTSDGLSAGLVRLRTARLSFDSEKTSVMVGQDAPFFSPRSPTSLASSAYPALSSAGNLWTWTPQVRVERRVALSANDTLSLQGGLLDPFTGELPGEYRRIPTAGERSRAPAYAMRLGWQRAGDRSKALGAGAYYSRQNWGFDRTVDSWVVTTDWELPIGRSLMLSGELYRGRAIAGLGAGASPSVLFIGSPSSASSSLLPLNSIGGWSQLKVKASERFEFNTAFGQDQSFRNGLAPLLSLGAVQESPSRNASGFFNFIYQARSNLLFSIEYRRLWTWSFYDPRRTADHISITSGIVF